MPLADDSAATIELVPGGDSAAPQFFGQTGYAASGVSRSGGLAPNQEWISPEPIDTPAYTVPGAAPSALAESRLALPGAKEGIVQRIQFLATYLAPGGADGMGMDDLDLRMTLGIPVPGVWPPFLVTPGFAVHYMDGPASPDVPPRLYDSWLEVRWLKPLGDRWVADLAIAPGWYSDFESSDSQALRIQGRALGIYEWSPGVKIVLGVVYLDREDVRMLPAGGLIWEGNGGDTKVELLFPRPRIAWRFGAAGNIEYWWYIGGEFGGGTWAVKRESGVDDLLTINDLRALFGVERQVLGGISSRFEIGYVFDRELEYESGESFDPTDTVLVRAGLTY